MNNPLSLVLLLPGLISLYFVIRGDAEKAFLRVYLPALLLLPAYYSCRLPHLLPITSAEAAMIPLAIAVMIRPPSGWRFCRLDLWVLLYMVSLSISELLHERVMNDGIMLVLSGILSMLFPYIIGRLLIEPKLRLPTTKVFVTLILFLIPFGLYEYRMGFNPYAIIGPKLLGIIPTWGLQIRGGRARVATSFSDAELAGIAFTVILTLNWWLVQINKMDRGKESRLGKWLSKLESKHIPGIILLALLLLTQSRGPFLGAALAYAILLIPKFKNTKLASIVIASILIVGALGIHAYLQKYTSGPITYDGTMSEQQASAAYRRLLLENYAPIIQEGGWLGWSYLSHPVVGNQVSIDNQFLLVQLGQGRLGLIIFILIGIETFFRLIKFTWTFKRQEDLYFAFSLLAAMAAIWSTITTVYLGEQLPQITFLLLGWSQSLQEGVSDQNQSLATTSQAKFSFKRVFA